MKTVKKTYNKTTMKTTTKKKDFSAMFDIFMKFSSPDKSRRKVRVTNVLPSCSNVGKIEALRWRRGRAGCGKHFLLSHPINITPKMHTGETSRVNG